MDKIAPGRYIVAVSGGVDSMVLLDKLRQMSGLDLIVAHADHGIRDDSHKDCELVEEYARQHKLVCITKKLHLGAGTSEDRARRARYNFLQQCRKAQHARAIILAHHQDDLIETVIIAIMRGTGWRGLAPFVGDVILLRPLLNVSKNELIGYARKHNVPWREDSTNTDERYLRNYIRHTLLPTFDQKSSEWQLTFLQHIRRQRILRQQIEHELSNWLHINADNQTGFSRYTFIMLSQHIAYQLLQQHFKQTIGTTLERPRAEVALLFVKTAMPYKVMQLSADWQLRVTIRYFIVEPRAPVVS